MTFTCSAGEQNFALDNKLLRGIDRLFFHSVAASGLHMCVCSAAVCGGEIRAVHTHGAGAAAVTATSAPVTPPPNTRLSSVNHAYAACKISPARDKPWAFVGKQILFCCKSITHCAPFTIRLSMAEIKL